MIRFKSDQEIAKLVENFDFGDRKKTNTTNFSKLLREMVEEVLSEAEPQNQDTVDKVLAILKQHPDYKNAEIEKVVGGDDARVEITNLGGDKMREKIAQVLQKAGLDVKVADRKNLSVDGQPFRWIQGGGKADVKDPMCGNVATCFENNIIWGIKLFADQVGNTTKAKDFWDPATNTGVVFGDCVDEKTKVFDPSKKGCQGNFISKDDEEAGKLVASSLAASVEEYGTLVDAGEVSGQTFEITKGYAGSGVTSGEPKTDISITTEKDGEEKVWSCSVKEAEGSAEKGYRSGGQFASAQGNELAAIVKTAMNRLNAQNPEILEAAIEAANMGPDQVGQMLQAVMARTTVYKARKGLLTTTGQGVQDVADSGVTAKGAEYKVTSDKEKELEEDALPYPTTKRASLWEDDGSAQDHTADVDTDQYAAEIGGAEKPKDPSWKTGSSTREFESKYSKAQKAILGKAMSYAMGFDDAIQMSDEEMGPLVQETKAAFADLLGGGAETKKLRADVLKEIFGTPLPVPSDMILGQAKFDAAQRKGAWEEMEESEQAPLLVAAKKKLVVVAQVKLAESIKEGLVAFQEANVEGMRKLMQNKQLRVEMLREAVTGVGKFKEGKESLAVPNAVVTWNRDGYAKFVSLEGEERDGEFDPDTWFKDNVDNVRFELRDRGTGRGFAGRVEKWDDRSMRPRQEMGENWEAINDSILLEDFMYMMGAGKLVMFEENLKFIDESLLTEEMLMEVLSWSDVTEWTKNKVAKGTEKGEQLLGKVKDFGREIIASAKAALQKAIAAAKAFYAEMKKFFAQVVSKLGDGIKGILSKDPLGGLIEVTGLVPEVDVSNLTDAQGA